MGLCGSGFGTLRGWEGPAAVVVVVVVAISGSGDLGSE